MFLRADLEIGLTASATETQPDISEVEHLKGHPADIIPLSPQIALNPDQHIPGQIHSSPQHNSVSSSPATNPAVPCLTQHDLTDESTNEPHTKHRCLDGATSNLKSSAYQINHSSTASPPLLSEDSLRCTEKTTDTEANDQVVYTQDPPNELYIQDLQEQIRQLKEENAYLARRVAEECFKKTTVVKNVVVSNAVIEAAVDAREAQMRVGLSNLVSTEEEIWERCMQLLNFSNDTSFLVNRLVVAATQEHQELIDDVEHVMMEKQFENARPNAEVAAIMEEKLAFVAGGEGGGKDVV